MSGFKTLIIILFIILVIIIFYNIIKYNILVQIDLVFSVPSRELAPFHLFYFYLSTINFKTWICLLNCSISHCNVFV